MISITQFTTEHIPAAIALWGSTDHIGLSSADEPAALTRYLERNPGFSFVALDSGRVIGAALCGHDGRRGFIHHLAVADSHRKSGLGRQLLNRCLIKLQEASIFKCHAFVFQDNPYTELFWEPVGWQRREELLIFSKFIEEHIERTE